MLLQQESDEIGCQSVFPSFEAIKVDYKLEAVLVNRWVAQLFTWGSVAWCINVRS